MTATEHHVRNGVLLAIGAYAFWGLVPLYYVPAKGVPAFEMLLHRVIWTCLALIPLCFVQRLWPEVKYALTHREPLLTLCATAFFIGGNWVIFMWAMTNDRVLHTSLGYFINPLLFVLLGVFFLKERLRRAQIVSVALAATGVGILIYRTGSLPWVALALPTLFALYGLFRRRVMVHTFAALFIETLLLAPFAIAHWADLRGGGDAPFATRGGFMIGWFLLLGPITVVPLSMFGAAAKRIPFTVMGFCQYIAPSGTFLLGVFYFREKFETTQFVTFVLIWVSLAIFTMDNLMTPRARVEMPIPDSLEVEAK